MARRTSAVLIAAIAAATLLSAVPSNASSAQEADFVSRINAERSSRGLSTLSARSDLAAVAREWAQHMAATGSISHDPDLPNKVSGWTALGDNVGKGPSVSAIHEAFMASDTHRHIILDADFNQVGVGIAQSGSTLFVTQIFAHRSSAQRPAPAPRPRAETVTRSPAVSQVAVEVVAVTGRIWTVDLTSAPVTVDVLMQLLALDAA